MKLSAHLKEAGLLLPFGLLLCFSSWRMVSDYLNPLHWEEPPEAFGLTFDSFIDIFAIVAAIYLVLKIKTRIGKLFWGIFLMSSTVSVFLRIVVSEGSSLVLVEMVDKILGALMFTGFGLFILFTKKSMYVFEEKKKSLA